MSYQIYENELNTRQVAVGAQFYAPDIIWQRLGRFVTPERLKRIENVALGRSRQFIPILSDIYDRGNISAVLRSAEGLGINEVHLIQRGERFRAANRVTRGAEDWLDLFTWPDPQIVPMLKRRGYRVFSTGFENAVSLSDVDFSQPTAFIFGNEKEGVKEDIKSLCDGCVYIPMQGFSQSFNISVAAAISMYGARQKIKTNDELDTNFYRARLLKKSLVDSEKLLGALNVSNSNA